MFKGYQWNNYQLKKKAQRYDWLAIIAMLVALGCLRWWSANAGLAFAGLTVLFVILSVRAKNRDKQLRNPK